MLVTGNRFYLICITAVNRYKKCGVTCKAILSSKPNESAARMNALVSAHDLYPLDNYHLHSITVDDVTDFVVNSIRIEDEE